jgi:UrcA family protein
MKTLIIVIAAFAMTGLTTATVYAQSAENAPTAKVFYGDLNLRSTSGFKTLKSRIHSAARAVCTTNDHSADTVGNNQHCIRVAVNGAMKQIPDTSSAQMASR